MSERELGISNDHEEILLLDEHFVVGRTVSDYFPVGETVLQLDVNPNRPDLWGMIGVARELAAILRIGFRIPEVVFDAVGEPSRAFGLRVEAEDLCPRYDLRRVSNLMPGRRAPLEMRRRIFAAGMRPINAVVDATNYVMLETGQPIHAFDTGKIRDGIVVRRAARDEKITLLDGSTRTLDDGMLVIADEERGLGIAGVMGAEDAEVGDDTNDALIEVANFVGRNIMATSQRLGLRTDASSRFERGLDPNMVDFAMERVVGLLTERPEGRAAPDVLSHYPAPVRPWEVSMRVDRAELLLGMPVAREEAEERLVSLGCEARGENGSVAAVVPTFRQDLTREADLIEEVGRLLGLDKVPEELPGIALPGGLNPAQRKARLVRRVLADLGLAEAITYPFGPARWREDLGLDLSDDRVLELRNPLSAQAAELRPMLLPGLLDAAARNKAFGTGGVLFELGRVFAASPPPEGLRETAVHFRLTGEVENVGPDAELSPSALMGAREEQRVGAVLVGTIRPEGWNVPERRAGFFEAKGIVERLIPGAEFVAEPLPFLHAGRCARVRVGGLEVGWVGELHPAALDGFDLAGWPVAAFELDLAFCEPYPTPRFAPFTNVPAVGRDLAVVVDVGVPVGDMVAAVDGLRIPVLVETRVFDVYDGPQVPDGKKSVALGFTFQGEETLTDEALNAELRKISGRLESEFGAQVRGA